jgi:glycosyltransferase involved in cell wall biosynthesis
MVAAGEPRQYPPRDSEQIEPLPGRAPEALKTGVNQTAPPKVSVVIPVYNRQNLVAACIDSVLGQTHPALEVILVDDGSTDETHAILQGYGDRIRVIRQSNAGPYVARNRALEAATGSLVTFADSDDRMHPEKIERQVARFQRSPELVLVLTHYLLRDERGSSSVPRLPDPLPHANDLVREILRTGGTNILWATMMVRTESIRRVGFFDTTHRLAMDQELGIRLAETGPFERIDEPLYEVTLHGDHLSRNLERKEAALLYIIEKHCGREPYLRDEELRREATANVYLRLASGAYTQDLTARARVCLARSLQLWPRFVWRSSFLLLALKIQLGRKWARRIGRLMGRGDGPRWGV